MQVKDESGAVLVLESTMVMQLVMLCMLLFVFSSTIILQKNQMHYHTTQAVNVYAQSFDKSDAYTMLLRQNQMHYNVNAQDYIQLYKNPRPYRHIFSNNEVVFPIQNSLHNEIKSNQVGELNGLNIYFETHSHGLLPKTVQAKVAYTLPIWSAIRSDINLVGEFDSQAPIVLTNDFVRQVDLAAEIMTQKLSVLKQAKDMKGLLLRVNRFLRQIRYRE